MKKILLTLIMVGAANLCSQAATVKQWDFNSVAADGIATTGRTTPSTGSGAPTLTSGGVGSRFGTVAAAATSDPNTLDNSMWRLGTNLGGDGFPEATVSNKTTGATFPINTSGYQNIHVTWDQENSSSSSRYWRVQYTTNGTDWVDHTTVITSQDSGDMTNTPPWQIGLTTDFTGVAGVNNNTNFGFRLVSEFESTATASGTNAYVATRLASNYGTGGTLWLDMVTVTGDDLDPANTFPQISAITNISVLVSNTIPQVAFTVSDAETAAASLEVSAVSSNPSLANSFSFGGSGTDRTLDVTPVPGATGVATITVRVQDGGGKVTESSFELSIVAPSISRIFGQQTTFNVPITVTFTVTNLPGDPAQFVFSGTSSVTNLVPNSGISFGNNGTNFTVTLTPVNNPATIGNTLITLVVSSAGRQATTSFNFRLLPPIIVFYDLSAVPVTPAPTNVAATVVNPGLTAGVLTRGPTLAAAGLTRGFSANNWNGPASSPTPLTANRSNALAGDYFQFSVTVGPNSTASLSTIEVSLRRSALNAPMNFEWLYSFDNFATPGVTIVPSGAIWDSLGWEDSFFTYLGRSATGTVGSPANYSYMVTRVDSQDAGNPTPTFDLTDLPALQNLPAGTVITFRLIAWGNAQTVDSNTVALGRDNGPKIRGFVVTAPTGTTLQIVQVGSNVEISWPDTVSGVLERSGSLPATWQPVGITPTQSGGRFTVTVPATGTAQFFRLHQ